MKRYEHLTLGHSTNELVIRTTDLRMAEAITHEAQQLVTWKLGVHHPDYADHAYEWRLKSGSSSTYIAIYMVSWLCSNGWEPYAVAGQSYYFRKELPPEPAEG